MTTFIFFGAFLHIQVLSFCQLLILLQILSFICTFTCTFYHDISNTAICCLVLSVTLQYHYPEPEFNQFFKYPTVLTCTVTLCLLILQKPRCIIFNSFSTNYQAFDSSESSCSYVNKQIHWYGHKIYICNTLSQLVFVP